MNAACARYSRHGQSEKATANEAAFFIARFYDRTTNQPRNDGSAHEKLEPNARGGLLLYRTQPRAGQIHDVVPISQVRFDLELVLLMAQHSSGDNEIELSMTRRDIADYLGLTIETVSRTISQFQNDALIGVASARRIVLCDGVALTKVAVNEASYRHAVSTETVD
jgi:CRP-like cAMP-binding protein